MYKSQGKFVRVLLLDLSTFILPISLCIDLCPVFLLIKDTDVENFISFEGTNNLNHLSDVIVCDATQLISIIRRSP